MSKPLLVASLALAALAFGYTLADGSASVPFFTIEYATGLPIVIVAITNGVAVFLGIWIYEGIFYAVRSSPRA